MQDRWQPPWSWCLMHPHPVRSTVHRFPFRFPSVFFLRACLHEAAPPRLHSALASALRRLGIANFSNFLLSTPLAPLARIVGCRTGHTATSPHLHCSLPRSHRDQAPSCNHVYNSVVSHLGLSLFLFFFSRSQHQQLRYLAATCSRPAPMLDLVLEILRLFITFLQSVETILDARLEQHRSAPALPLRPRTPSPSPSASISNAPTPGPWTPGRTNKSLRADFLSSGVCEHYCHAAARPRLNKCPVCRESLQ